MGSADGAMSGDLNQGPFANGRGVDEAMKTSSQFSRDVRSGLRKGKEASGGGVSKASGVTWLAPIPGVCLSHMSFVAVLTPGSSGEGDEGECAKSLDISGRGAPVGLIRKADKTISCFKEDRGREAFEGFVREGRRGSRWGARLASNETDRTFGGSVV
jgi:hypothetical protein